MIITVRAGKHARATARSYPRRMRKVRHDDIGSGLSKVIDPSGDQRWRVSRSPKTINQCANLQVPEIRIILHLLTRYDNPPDILFGALSAYPESRETGIVRGINDIQSRSVRPYCYPIVWKAIREDPVRPVVKSVCY